MQRVLFLAALLVAPALTKACTCAGLNPVCPAYSPDAVIFRGRVAEQTLIDPPEQTVKNLDGSTSTVQGFGYYRVRFSVLETFAGASRSQEIDVLTNEQSSACGFTFITGAEYFVFASPNQDTSELWTSKCSRTHQLEPGKEDPDVAWMRALATAPPSATILGTLLPSSKPAAPSPPVTIQLRGPENHNAVLDQNGRYAFPNLPPGQYSVSAAVPAGFTIDGSRTVAVREKTCSEVDFRVRYDGHIRGIVTDADGRSLPGIFIALQRRDPASATGFTEVDLKDTGPDGRYDFSPVAPGDYLVSANHLGPSVDRPYPRFYYGNTESGMDAETIHLAPSGTIDNINIALPDAWKRINVHARVLLSGGAPAIGADVSAYDLKYLYSGEPARADSDSQGQATLSVYESRTYYLVATISGGTQQRCAGPLKFAAKDGVTLAPITIEHNWGNCLAQLNPEFQPPK